MILTFVVLPENDAQYHFHQKSVNLSHNFQLGIKFSGAYSFMDRPMYIGKQQTIILVNIFK